MLIDLPFNGIMRRMVVRTGKLGIKRDCLDRSGTDAKTINQAAIPHIGQTTVNWPADPGGRG